MSDVESKEPCKQVVRFVDTQGGDQGDKDKDGQLEPRVPDTPPVIRLPCCPMPFQTMEIKSLSKETVEVVTEVDRCRSLVARLQREKVLAVASEGINVGREGPLTLMQIGTCTGLVYLFDILTNRDLFNKGRLKALLEDSNVVKVMHDSSSVSAALSFQFATTLSNVFDTQVAHAVIEEHKGHRLVPGIKISEICMQYSEDMEKFYTYDWRTDSKTEWMAMIGNFWANRPLTPDMIEFAAGDVIVLIPDVYRHQQEYIEDNKLTSKFNERVQEWLQVEIDDVIKEGRGKRTANLVESILKEMDSTYDDRATLFNILDQDHMNALALVTYEDAANISKRILRLKTEHIMADIGGMEQNMRMEAESWERRHNILDYLRYYSQIPSAEIRTKSNEVLNELIKLILEHIQGKYRIDTTPNMLSATESDALLTIPYTALEGDTWCDVIKSIYWKFMQDEIHEMINLLRFYPARFALTEEEYAKLEYFAGNTSFVPEEVGSLAAGLLHAVRAYNAANGGYVVGERRRSGVYQMKLTA